MAKATFFSMVSAVLLIALVASVAHAGRVLLICNEDLWNQSDCWKDNFLTHSKLGP